MKLMLIYSRSGGGLLSDGECEGVIKFLYRTAPPEGATLHVSTENIIHAARVLIKEGVFDPNEVVFKLYRENNESLAEMKADKDGRLKDWPRGFCDVHDDLISRLL